MFFVNVLVPILVSRNFQKTFFVNVKKKVRTKKKLRPIFGILTFGGLFSRKYSENFLCLLYVYQFLLNSEPC